MNGGLVFLIVLLLLVFFGYGGWVAYSRLQASRNGLPPPSLNPFASLSGGSGSNSGNYPGPAPTGIKGWIDAQVHKFKNRNNRYAAGAYEEPGGTYGGGARARGAGHRLDPDEAWDARVGNEAYYEEQELGLQEPVGHRQGGSGAATAASSNPFESSTYEPERGRSRNREYGEDAAHHLGGPAAGGSTADPFGDDHAASLRGVSPRPLDHGVDTSYGGASAQAAGKKKKAAESPADASRRSLFHEEI